MSDNEPEPIINTETRAVSEEKASICVDRLRETMRRLREATEYDTKRCQKDLKFVSDALVMKEMKPTQANVETTNAVVELGLATLFAEIFSKCFYVDWSGPDGRSIAFSNMCRVALSMCNATDKSPVLCRQVVDDGLHTNILKYLNDPKLDPARAKNTGIKNCVFSMMCILYNALKKCDEARKAYRDASAVDILTKFRSAAFPKTMTIVIILLADIVTEKENEKINSDDDNIQFIIHMLRQVYNVKTGPRIHGFSTNELLGGLNKLANNDSNKVRIVRLGALPLYTGLLTIGDQEERRLAVEGIRCLAFRCRAFINQEPGCVEALRTLASSEDEQLCREVKGALWQLDEHFNHTADTAAKGIDSTDGRKHVMISYQWGSQELMKRIRDELKSAGYEVWMDLDNMSGSPLEAMALAVEDASVVLIAASTKYKDSANCRTEGEYAYNKRRDIIPLIVEPGYKPDGWLGPLVLNNLYFDFAKQNILFDKKMAELIKEMGLRMKCSFQSSKEECTMKVTPSSTLELGTHAQPADAVGKQQESTAKLRNHWARCLCCLWPCNRSVYPEEQQRPDGESTISISGCCHMIVV